jgi:hypothetical protein
MARFISMATRRHNRVWVQIHVLSLRVNYRKDVISIFFILIGRNLNQSESRIFIYFQTPLCRIRSSAGMGHTVWLKTYAKKINIFSAGSPCRTRGIYRF